MKRKILSVVMVLLLVMNLGMVVSAEDSETVTDTVTGTVDGYSFRGTSVINNSGASARTECYIGCVVSRVISTYRYVIYGEGEYKVTKEASAHNYASVSFTGGDGSVDISSAHMATNEQTGHVSSITTYHLYW